MAQARAELVSRREMLISEREVTGELYKRFRAVRQMLSSAA